MKYSKLIYSDFVSNRPEPTTLLELWCLIGGFLVAVFVVSDTGMGFSGMPKLETILALVFPAFFFFLHYMSREFYWFKKILVLSIVGGMSWSFFLLFYPIEPRNPFPFSDIALIIFCLVSLVLILTKSMRR